MALSAGITISSRSLWTATAPSLFLGESRFTEAEIRQVLSVTGIAEDRLRAWEQQPKGDVRNPLAR